MSQEDVNYNTGYQSRCEYVHHSSRTSIFMLIVTQTTFCFTFLPHLTIWALILTSLWIIYQISVRSWFSELSLCRFSSLRKGHKIFVSCTDKGKHGMPGTESAFINNTCTVVFVSFTVTRLQIRNWKTSYSSLTALDLLLCYLMPTLSDPNWKIAPSRVTQSAVEGLNSVWDTH